MALQAETLSMLRDSLSRYLTEQFSVEQRRRLLADKAGERRLWQGLVQSLGVAAASFDENVDGIGGTTIEALPLMTTFGESLAAQPYLSTVVVAGTLLTSIGDERCSTLIRAIIDGEVVVAFAHDEAVHPFADDPLQTRLWRDGETLVLNGRKSAVIAAPSASHLLVTAVDDQLCLHLVLIDADHPGLLRRDVPMLDRGWAGELGFDDLRVPASASLAGGQDARTLLATALDVGTIGLCFEACGVMQQLMTATTAYANQRRQFGAPLASFQVLQHRIVDMHLALEQARALTSAAATGLDGDPLARARAVSSAKVMVSRACRTVGQGAIQVHGGMGMTDELALSDYFKRAMTLSISFGDEAQHLRRLAALAQG